MLSIILRGKFKQVLRLCPLSEIVRRDWALWWLSVWKVIVWYYCLIFKISRYVHSYIYGIGYLLRNLKFLQNVEKTTSLTIFLLLFILGLSIGSNSLIINNLGRFGWQAVVLAASSILGSMLASFLVFRLFFRKGGKKWKGVWL